MGVQGNGQIAMQYIDDFYILNRLVTSTDRWPLVCEILISAPADQTQSYQRLLHGYRCSAMKELFRRRWNSAFKLTDWSREAKKQIIYDVDIADALLNLVQEVHLLFPDRFQNMHEAIWFLALMVEGEAWSPFLLDEDVTTKLAQIRRYRHITCQVRDGCNPFTEPFTFQLFDVAIQLAEHHDNFRRNFIAPFIKARQQMTTHMQEHGVILQEKDGRFIVQRQGRKKVDRGSLAGQGIQKKRSS